MVENQNEQILSKFDEIEHNVLQLLERVKVLESKNKQLNQNVSQLQQELEEKVKAENQYLEEKALIRNKVDGLLKKIDEFAVPA